MTGMIFAAGIGSRLRPITDQIPKALVNIAGKTMLHRAIENLNKAGVDSIVVNVHHHAKIIVEYLKANASILGNIAISDESERLLDTGGGLVNALRFFNSREPLVAINVDILTNIPIADLIHAHEKSGADVTLSIMNRDTSRQLLFDSSKRLRGWRNISTGETIAKNDEVLYPFGFCGIHVISPHVFQILKDYSVNHSKFSLTPFYLDCMDIIDIHGHEASSNYLWHDIGTPERLSAATEALLSMEQNS